MPRGVRVDQRMGGLDGIGTPQDVVRGPLGGIPETLWRADARACVSLWCRAWVSVKAGVLSVGCTDYNGLCPQLFDLELTQLGECGVDRKAGR